MSPGLSVCIVNYNGERVLRACLDAVADATRSFDREVIVIDSASIDGSRLIAANHPSAPKLIALDVNRGPGAARNEGFAIASAPRILFVDNDVVLTPHTAGALMQALDGDVEAVACMPRVCDAEDPDRIQFDGAEAHYLGLLALHHAGESNASVPVESRRIGSMVTACFLLDRTRWGNRPPFDAAFFFNYEDHDFGLRARCLGHEILAVPAATCLHGSGTPGLSLRAGGVYARRRVVCLVRNRWWILIKVYSLSTLFALAPMLIVYECFQLAGCARRGWLGAWLEGVRDTVTRLPDLLAERRRLQGERRRGDGALLCGGSVPLRTDLPSGELERRVVAFLSSLARRYWGLVGRGLAR